MYEKLQNFISLIAQGMTKGAMIVAQGGGVYITGL